MERGWGGGGALVKIVVVVTIQIKQLIDKGYFNDLFFNNFKQFLTRKFKNNFKNDEITLVSQPITATGYDLF